MRLKAGHSMMASDPSTPDREVQTGLRVRPSQQKVPPSSKPREDIRRDRTSMLGSPAIDPLPPQPARIGKQRHQACRSSRARRPVGLTTDDADRKPREERSCGCSQTSLYNKRRLLGARLSEPGAVRGSTHPADGQNRSLIRVHSQGRTADRRDGEGSRGSFSIRSRSRC